MNDVQLLELIAETDLYGFDSPLPESTWSRAVAFREIERRIGMDTRDTMRESQRTDEAATGSAAPGGPRRRWSAAWVAALAFVVVLGIVGAVIAAVNLGGGEDVAAEPEEPRFGIESALETTDAYLVAETSGDLDGALALMTPELREGLGGYVEQLITYQQAAEVIVSVEECAASGDTTEVVVECPRASTSYLDRTVAAPGTESILTVTVTPDGIARIFEAPTESASDPVFDRFQEWMDGTHPQDALLLSSMFAWPSVARAEQAGETVVRYADEYAAYLVANGCSYDTTCTPFGVDGALLTAESYLAAERAGDVDAALALLTAELRAGLGAEIERRLILIPAAGWTRTPEECTGSGDATEVAVECVGRWVDPLYSAVGAAGFETTVTMRVTPEGIAEIFEDATDNPSFVILPFKAWLRGTHPEAVDAVGGFLEWSSVEAADASAAVVLTYADEYAAFLEVNGCAYDEPCTP